ncbi:3-oxoacyl-[acyl-carrier-protein] synthase III C-terminal domain-containing protein [Amycolatopsis benzoatilytica]|uniref:3-oxoacyl-[acyl-carrier-protein] synthase III C-terminal domain-containing protein n=1 Tax=Amycolatopsis benzoatilytica TaxID=346045 RepID=UPI0003A36562|nr:3-oxoacyl-[acyl-carrier-protein] synthase III C-terminal domain-containing protein [Amycolatopsis benzoatilytica]
MRTTVPVGICAAGTWLPDSVSTASDAVAAGRLPARQARALGHSAVPSAGSEAPPDMAVHAARAAMKEASVSPADIYVLAHAWMYYQGHDLWSPPHYIAREIDATSAFPVGIRQVCNGGAAALELTAAKLVAEAGAAPRIGLVTTADRFAEPGFDRWASDYGVAYGDGATAVVLRAPAEPGDLLLRAIVTVAAPELEEMHRGEDPFGTAARAHRDRIDMRATKRAFLRDHGTEPFTRANESRIREVTRRALADAGLDARGRTLRYALLPRFGRKTLDESWLPVLAEETGAEPLDLGKETGHLGAGDAAAGLAGLRRADLLSPGDSALVFSAGAGFTWSCLVVQNPSR